MGGMNATILAVLALALAWSLTGLYWRLMLAYGRLEQPTDRGMHRVPVPSGAGAAIVAAALVLWPAWQAPGGGLDAVLLSTLAALALVSWLDDRRGLSPMLRLSVHAAAVVLLLASLGPDQRVLPMLPLALERALMGLAWLWFINLYNFMDGIDGMATSGAVFFSAAAVAILEWQGGSAMSLPLALLGVASLGFLVFNWSPARLFLGDAGSNFYGYAIAVVVLITVVNREISFWTWVILLAYFLGDTTTTMLIRVFTVKRWWGTHRGHAYQNLARVWANHRRMTSLVIAIHLGWLAPLAAASVVWPRYQVPLALLALAVPVAMAVRFGPRYAK
jgi:Fuc2NAc and GlcNAc transferase